MRQLSVGGKVFEVSEDDYLHMLDRMAKGYWGLAESYHNIHESGFADWKGTFQWTDVGQNELNTSIANQIDDDELFRSFNSLKEKLLEMEELDEHIVEWLGRFVGLSSVHDKQDKARLGRRLKKIIVSGPNNRPQGPVWAMQPEYQQLIVKSKEILAAIGNIQSRIEERIQKLLEDLSGQ